MCEEEDGCGGEGCAELKRGLVNLFGMEWRNVVFGGDSLRQFDIGEMEDLRLLLGLGNSDSFEYILLRLLGQRSRESMLICVHIGLCACGFRTRRRSFLERRMPSLS